MSIDNLRRVLDIDPALWHLHIRYHDTNWLGQPNAPRDELYECDNAEVANELAKTATERSASLMFVESLNPGEMPALHRPDAWYLHAHIVVDDGTILQRNVRRQLLDPHDIEEQAREALKKLQYFMIGQGGLMLYAAIVPPAERGPTIVIKPRR
mgnify:CR=1 FL=1